MHTCSYVCISVPMYGKWTPDKINLTFLLGHYRWATDDDSSSIVAPRLCNLTSLFAYAYAWLFLQRVFAARHCSPRHPYQIFFFLLIQTLASLSMSRFASHDFYPAREKNGQFFWLVNIDQVRRVLQQQAT